MVREGYISSVHNEGFLTYRDERRYQLGQDNENSLLTIQDVQLHGSKGVH
jgi:hypothetical protein